MQPSRHSMRSRSGRAVLALKGSSTAVRASTRRLAWAQPPAPVVGTAPALAVDGHDLTVGQGKGRLHPVPEALLEAGRIQPREDPSQRVVRRDPVGQRQEGAQPGLVERAEEGDGHETVGAAEDGRHRQHQDVRRVVQLGAVDPRIPGRSRVSTRDEDIGPSLRGFSAG